MHLNIRFLRSYACHISAFRSAKNLTPVKNAVKPIKMWKNPLYDNNPDPYQEEICFQQRCFPKQ